QPRAYAIIFNLTAHGGHGTLIKPNTTMDGSLDRCPRPQRRSLGRRFAPHPRPRQRQEPGGRAPRAAPPGGAAPQGGAGRRVPRPAGRAARQARDVLRFRRHHPRDAGRAGMIVLDASVAAKAYLEEPGSDEAIALLTGRENLLAPELIRVEVAAALLRRVR